METFYDVGFTAKSLTAILLEECYRLYGGEPGDDTTACTIRIRKREPMNLVVGPPSNRDDDQQDDEPVLLQGGQAYRLRRHARPRWWPRYLGKQLESTPGFRRSGNPAHRQDRGRGPGDRRA